MFFLPYSYCFLSLDAKTQPNPNRNTPPIPPSQIQHVDLCFFSLNKMGISLQVAIKYPFPISFSSNDSSANSGCYF